MPYFDNCLLSSVIIWLFSFSLPPIDLRDGPHKGRGGIVPPILPLPLPPVPYSNMIANWFRVNPPLDDLFLFIGKPIKVLDLYLKTQLIYDIDQLGNKLGDPHTYG